MKDKKPELRGKNKPSRDSMFGVPLTENWEYLRDDERAKQTFFKAIGLIDERPYIKMDAEETINTIRQNAGITLSDIGIAMGITGDNKGASPFLLIKKASWWNGAPGREPLNALRLGELMAPMLQQKVQEKVITLESFTKRLVGPKEATAREEAKNNTQKKVLFAALDMSEKGKAYHQGKTACELMAHYCHILSRNCKIAQQVIAKEIDPYAEGTYLSNRVAGHAKIDAQFIQKLAAIIKPHLLKGVQEGWLDAGTLDEKPIEAILADKLPAIADKIAGKKGLEALRVAIDVSGLPDKAIGPMTGRENNRIGELIMPGSIYHLYAKETADIAEAIAPYVTQQKKWTGVLDVTKPEHFVKHQYLQQYVIAEAERVAGKPLHHMRQISRKHNTVGPFIREVRDALDITQKELQEGIWQSEAASIESNCFNMNCIDAEGNLSSGYKRKFDAFAQKFGEAYKTRGPIVVPAGDKVWKEKAKNTKTSPGIIPS